MKSDTCFGKMSGEPLSVYFDEDEAKSAAEYSKEIYNNELSPYKCNKCDFWHLSPKFRVTPSEKCQRCTAGDGSSKDTYRTKKEANTRADIVFNEQGINLRVYKCKYAAGWHLTKSHY
jgi:hypothetical protein